MTKTRSTLTLALAGLLLAGGSFLVPAPASVDVGPAHVTWNPGTAPDYTLTINVRVDNVIGDPLGLCGGAQDCPLFDGPMTLTRNCDFSPTRRAACDQMDALLTQLLGPPTRGH